jgi:hypothetical protein
MLVRRSAADYKAPFELLGFTVVVEETNGTGVGAQAMVKLRVHGEVVHTAAEGAGPVNALDCAVRKGLLPHYPELADVHLVDYKVRIVDEHLGTAAKPRVVLESARGSERWSTVGCSENIIEASWQALKDSLELPLLRGGTPEQNRLRKGVPWRGQPVECSGTAFELVENEPKNASLNSLCNAPAAAWSSGCRSISTPAHLEKIAAALNVQIEGASPGGAAPGRAAARCGIKECKAGSRCRSRRTRLPAQRARRPHGFRGYHPPGAERAGHDECRPEEQDAGDSAPEIDARNDRQRGGEYERGAPEPQSG